MPRPAPAKIPKIARDAAKATGSGGSEVERRWREYWACRKRLEEAVEKVRAATDTLKAAQEQEKARRSEFDEIKRSLTKLLDVDPVTGASREPIPLAPRSVADAAAPKQLG
jgi:hypothetical protein